MKKYSLVIAIAILVVAFALGINSMAEYAMQIKNNFDQAGEHTGLVNKKESIQFKALDN